MTSPEQQDSAPDVADGTDVDAAELDVEGGETPATSDPDAYADDPELGGTGGGSAGGAG